MSSLLKSATLEELDMMMSSLLCAEDISDDQSSFLLAIVDELKERGEYKEFFEEDTSDYAKELVKKALEEPPVEDYSWVERAMLDAKADRRIKKRNRLRFVASTLAVVVVILLTNTITISVSGINFIDDFTRWGVNAIYSLFGFERVAEVALVGGEMQPLQDKLDELGIAVTLPKSMLQGFRFLEVIVSVAGEPYMLNAWFQQYGEQKTISLTIDGTPQNGPGSLAEVSEAEEYEPIVHNGVTYRVYGNYERIQVIWKEGTYLLLLQGDMTYAEARAIIESI